MRVETTEKVPIKLWLDDIEDGAMQQARDLANLPFVHKWVAIMPDSHQGYGMPIGGVLATKGVVIPNAVGVDIGCGMCALRTPVESIDTYALKEIMSDIRKVVPVGFAHHKEPRTWTGFSAAPNIPIIQNELEAARYQLGTLGGGNHFIEIQHGSDGYVWLMLHSGSRNFGYKIAKTYHEKAIKLCDQWYSNVPNKDLSFLPADSAEGCEYVDAMRFALDFARANRYEMMRQIAYVFEYRTGAKIDEEIINIHHNYVAIEHHYGENVWVHRKGATLAREGTTGIVPGSQGTKSYIVKGLGNPESFMSCSHGAGRRMGRKEARRTLTVEGETQKLAGVIHSIRSEKDLDEAPGAYKDISEVMANQRDLVDIEIELTPLAVIKG